MNTDITISDHVDVNFAPSSVREEIVQNVKTICATQKYTVPMDRNFGVSMNFIDQPTPKAKAQIQAEIIEAIREYEPRCKVRKVSFEGDIDGNLTVKVRIEIGEE